MKAKNRLHKLLSVLICCVMLLGMFPAAVSARDCEGDSLVIPFQKTWDDSSNAQGFRPREISVSLYKYSGDSFDAKKATLIESKKVTADSGWKCSFNVSSKSISDADGDIMKLKVVEGPVDKYQESAHTDPSVVIEPMSVTGWSKKSPCDDLSFSAENFDRAVIAAKKGSTYIFWTKDSLSEDERKAIFNAAKNDIEGFGQGSYSNAVFISGYGCSHAGVSVGNNKITFDKSDKWFFIAKGTYSKAYLEIQGGKITNKYIPQTVTVSGSKTWDDSDNQDGKRPESITVKLMNGDCLVAKKTVTAEDGWKWTFENLPKYDKCKEIKYTIVEEKVDEYTATYNGYNIVNKYVPKTVTVSGSKTWDDDNNRDGKRPESITVKLMNGDCLVEKKTVTAEDGWKWTFENLPKYNKCKEIKYTIVEEKVDEYTATYDGYNITNKYVPKTVTVSGSKTWDDANNQDGKRPESITIKLMAGCEVIKTKTVTAQDGWKWSFENLPKYNKCKEIKYTIVEEAVNGYKTIYDGYNVTNRHIPETIVISGTKTWNDADNQDGKRPESITIKLMNGDTVVKTAVVTAEDGWKWSFEGLAKYSAGNEIKYTIVEETVDGYETEYDGYNVINSYTPKTITISGAKTWDDANNQDGIRPESITVKLMNGETVVDSAVVTAEDEWSWEFKDVFEYANGKKIVYNIEEQAISGYSAIYDGYNVTNIHIPETVTFAGTKTWSDADNQDGIRPEIITVKLMDGETALETVTVTAESQWSWSFAEQPRYRAGEEIEYTVIEEAVEGYTAAYNKTFSEEDNLVSFAVENIHIPETVTFTGLKTWSDADNQDGIRPESITVKLMDGETALETVTVTSESQWSWSFAEQPRYRAGEEIEYTVIEEVVEGYTAAYNETFDEETNLVSFAVENTHIPETVTFTGTKTWSDADNQDGIRPESITVKLMDGETILETVAVTAESQWSWSFAEQPRYRAGEEIEYTVIEEEVEGYTVAYNKTFSEEDNIVSFAVENTHIPETVTFAGSKTWSDADNQDGKRPESITVKLMDGETALETVAVTAESQWSWSFAEQPRYRGGAEIDYTVIEEEVEGYTAAYNETFDEETNLVSFAVENTHIPETISISGSKTWDDADNQDGKRPESITVVLMKNGETVDTRTVTANDDWSWNFENIAKYENGVEIVYSIVEETVDGYETIYDGYNVTNRYTPGKITIAVSKTWKDSNNKEEARPESVTIQLYADGVAVEGKVLVLNEENSWRGSFTDLPEYKDGNKIVYTISENEVEGYKSVIGGNSEEGFKVTNTYITVIVPEEPEETEKEEKPLEQDVPHTGDNANAIIWTAILMAAFLVIGADVLFQNKKRSRKDQQITE